MEKLYSGMETESETEVLGRPPVRWFEDINSHAGFMWSSANVGRHNMPTFC